MSRIGPARLTVFAFTVLIVLMSLAYGFQHRFAARYAEYFAILSVPFLLLVLALVGAALYFSGRHRFELVPGRLALAFTSATWVLTAFFHSDAWSGLHWLLVALIPPAAGALAERWRTATGAWVILAAALPAMAYLGLSSNFDPEGANMLPLVLAGSRDFFAGLNPYLQSHPDIAQILHFHYLPALWLPYAWLDRYDIAPQVFNVTALVAMLALLGWAAFRRARLYELSLLLLPLCVSPPIAQMIMHGHIWPYWLLCVALAVALVEYRLGLSAVLLGLLLAARQLALFIAAPIAVHFLTQLPIAKILRHALLSIGAYALLILPFLLTTPDFLTLTYVGLPEKMGEHIVAGNANSQLGALGLLVLGGLEDWRLPIQLFLLSGFAILIALRRSLDIAAVLALSGGFYLLLISFNPFIYRYHYVPGLLLLIAGLVLRGGSRSRVAASPSEATTS